MSSERSSQSLGSSSVRQTPEQMERRALNGGMSAAPSAAPLLLSDEAAALLYGVSVRKFHELRREPWFGIRPVVLGPRLLRWPRAELEAAIASMPRQTTATEPVQLLRGRIERLKAAGKNQP